MMIFLLFHFSIFLMVGSESISIDSLWAVQLIWLTEKGRAELRVWKVKF